MHGRRHRELRRQASFAIRPRLRVQARRGRETAETDSEGPCVSGIPATARRAADYRRRGPRRAWRARRVHARRGGASARARARPSVTVTAMVLLRCSMHTPGAGATRCDALWLRLRWMRLRWMRAGAEDRLAGHHAFWPRCMHGARLRTRGLRLRPGYGSRMRVKQDTLHTFSPRHPRTRTRSAQSAGARPLSTQREG